MSGLVLPQLLKEEYPSYPGSAPAAASLKREADSIWEKNREYLERFKNDILTSEPRSKEFRFAIRVAKHFFGTDNTYDASGVAEALQFIDVIRKRHEAVVATSAERQLLQSVRKVLSVIFQHHHKFNDPRDLQKIITAYTTFHARCLVVGAEAPNPPFNNPYNTNISMAIDPALANSTELQRPVIRPPPHLSQSPVHHSDLSSPTPLRSTDPATFLSFFDQASASNGLALPFQIEHQLSTNEVTVEQAPPVPARPPNRVASLLMRAMAAKKAAEIEAPVVEPSHPIAASSDPVVAPSDPVFAPSDPIAALIQMEGFPDPEDAEMQAGEPPLEEDMVFQWTLPHEPVSSPPQEKEAVVVAEDDTPMETLVPEVTQEEVPDVEEPVVEDTQMTLVPEVTQDEVPDVEEAKLEGGDDATESSLTNISTPSNVSTPSSLPHPDQPVTEPELPEAIQPSTLSGELREELHEAVRPVVTYFQTKSDNGAVNSQVTDESLVARYGTDLLRVAKEALDEIRTKYVIEEVKRSLNGSPTQEEDQLSDLFSEPDNVEPPAQEPVHSPPPPPQLDAEPESVADEPEVTVPPSTVEGLELTVSPSVAGEPELTIQMESEPAPLTYSEPAPLTYSEPAPLTYSEQGTQTSSVAIQVVHAKEQPQLYETQEMGIAGFTVHNECCRTSFSFEIAPEFYEGLRTDRTAKIIATCSQELGQSGDDPIDDSWILMRINWTGNPDAEFLLVPNKSRSALTKVQQVIPLGVIERVNRLDLRRSWCAGGLRGLKVDIKVARAVREQRKRGRETLDGDSLQDEADSEAPGHFVDTFKRARI